MQKLNQKGQGMTEYILIVALIAVVVIGAVKIFGGKVSSGFNNASRQVDDATSGKTNGVGGVAGTVNNAANAVNSVTGGN
jgi:pilus assembly protein Flp/PilA